MSNTPVYIAYSYGAESYNNHHAGIPFTVENLDRYKSIQVYKAQNERLAKRYLNKYAYSRRMNATQAIVITKEQAQRIAGEEEYIIVDDGYFS